MAGVVTAGPAAAEAQDGLICEIADLVLPVQCEGSKPPSSASQPPPATTTTPPASDPTSLEAPVRRTSSVVQYDPRRLGVIVRRSATRRDVEALFTRVGVEPDRAIPQLHAYLVAVDPEQRERALAALRRSALVANASREPLVQALDLTPDDTDWPQQWGLRQIGLPQAWAVTQGSSRVIVAVLDTGVDSQHADLRGALVPGYDFINSDSDPSDDHGHGTAVAGIIAARANNRRGVAGVCWSCSLMPVKVLDATGVGDDSVIAAGIVWAADHGARVINLSLGGPGVAPILSDAISYAAGKGVAVVAAAGNDGTSGLIYPAADPLAISVAGTTARDQRYTWSNFGSWVRVAAPGCNLAPQRGGGDVIFCGTSSSTPIVAGLVALAYSANPNATLAEVEQALQRSAVPLPAVAQYGRVSAPGTLALVRPRAPATGARIFQTLTGRFRPGGVTFPLVVGAGRLRATLKSPGALTLSLYIPDATTPLARVTGRSRLQLEAAVPAAGTVRFVVTGPKRARFSLAVSYARPENGTP